MKKDIKAAQDRQTFYADIGRGGTLRKEIWCFFEYDPRGVLYLGKVQETIS